MTGGHPHILVSRSPDQTEAIARALAPFIPAGTVLALVGDLAAGKTCFVRGLAGYFTNREEVHSPTFTLVNEYGNHHELLHLDLYRLAGPEDLIALGYEELFEPLGICAVEWADRAGNLLPAETVRLTFEHRGGDLRGIEIDDPSNRLGKNWVGSLTSFASNG